jgi:hypothetical protein
MFLAAPLVVLGAIVLGLRWLMKKASVKADDVIDIDGNLVGEALPSQHADLHDSAPLSEETNIEAERLRASMPGQGM